MPAASWSTRAARRGLALLPLALAACGGGGDGNGPAARVPAHIALASNAPSGAVNADVAPPPSVRVTDEAHSPVPNAAVTFVVGTGGGTITGGAQRTDAQGIATIGSWRLGTVTGTGHTLLASVGSIGTTIGATATAGSPSAAARAPGQPVVQLVAPSTLVPVRPAVRVTDAFGNPAGGVAVTFTTGANSGVISGAMQATNGDGVATVGAWTAGTQSGQQTVMATVSGVPPVTFTASVAAANGNACSALSYQLLTAVGGGLATTDCDFGNGSYVDFYAMTSASAVSHELRAASSTFDTVLWVFDVDGNALAAIDDPFPEGPTDAAIRLHAPAGTYVVAASSFLASATGPYTLSSVAPPFAPGCVYSPFIVPGGTAVEGLSATDCPTTSGNGGSAVSDEYTMVLQPGRGATVTMRSTAFNAFLRIFNGDGSPLTFDDDGAGGTDARATIAPASGPDPRVLFMVATSRVAGSTGAYSLEVSGGSAASASRAAEGAPVVLSPVARERAEAQATVLRADLAARRRSKRR